MTAQFFSFNHFHNFQNYQKKFTNPFNSIVYRNGSTSYCEAKSSFFFQFQKQELNLRQPHLKSVAVCSFQIKSAFKQVCYRFRLCNQCGGEAHSDASCISNTYATWATCMNDLNQKDSSTST
jgi:hypothetical protein